MRGLEKKSRHNNGDTNITVKLKFPCYAKNNLCNKRYLRQAISQVRTIISTTPEPSRRKLLHRMQTVSYNGF